jgi:chromosome segregation ATPase
MENSPIKIEYHYHNHVDTAEILSLLNIIKLQNHKLMALIDDLKTQVADLKHQTTDLQASVDAEQAQIQALLDSNAQVVTDLNTQIATLQAQVAAGATPEQLQVVIDGLTSVKDSISTTKADIEGTVQ